MLFNLAASEGDDTLEMEEQPITLERLPLSFQPLKTYKPLRPLVHQTKSSTGSTRILRTRGPFDSRCLGITVHVFLEAAAKRLMQVPTVETLLAELPEWAPRIQAVLRTHGLPRRIVQQHGRTVAQALHGTLSDPVGRWLLQAQEGARNELALATVQEEIRHYRVDRIFRAGATPREAGDRFLWLVDYKTTSYSGDLKDELALRKFLSHQRRTYEPQLQQYARLIPGGEIRLGLWFPLLQQLVWWSAGDSQNDVPSDLFPRVDQNGQLAIR